MEILEKTRRELVAARLQSLEIPPKDFKGSYNVTAGMLGAGAMSTVGVWAGSHVGIAMLGSAVSGAWVLAPILGIAGLWFGKKNE